MGRSHERRRRRLGFAYRFCAVVLWPFLRVFVKWDIRGDSRIYDSRGGILVASNHMSWFDPLVVSYVMWCADRPPRFLAKESLFRIPIVGRIISGAGQIPVYRESAEAVVAVRDAVAAIDAGEAVAIYPEGTMTKDPELWPMAAKTGAARIALITGCPLIPMAHWGTQEIMRPYRKEFRLLPRKTIHVRVGEPLDIADVPPGSVDRQSLILVGDRLMAAITDLQAGVRGESPPGVMPERGIPGPPSGPVKGPKE